MKFWQLSANCNLRLLVILSGCLSALAIQPGAAQEKSHFPTSPSTTKVENQGLPIPNLRDIELPATSAQMLVQQPTPTNPPANPPSQGEQQGSVAITGVKANPTDKGVEVILETTAGDKLQVANRSTGNNFIVDVAGGQLRLPNGDAFAFKSEKPIAGITEITVTNIDANTVRVTVVGEKALPAVELFDDDTGLIFTAAPTATTAQEPEKPTEEKPAEEKPAAQQDDLIELTVTGEADSYRVPNASTATLTDTPLRDIPQSIQVIPQQVIKDQGATSLTEVLENAPGISRAFRSPRSILSDFNSRGFLADRLKNGVPDDRVQGFSNSLSNIERVEVLKGPASVLFGFGSPGGTVNIVTKKPLREPFYAIEASAGSFNSYRGAIDLSGPLNDSKTVLYRLNASANTTESFIDFYNRQRYHIAPSLTWQIGERTKLNIEAEYERVTGTRIDYGLPAEGTVLPNPNGKIPRNRNTNEPFLNENDTQTFKITSDLEHSFSRNWQARSIFRVAVSKDPYATTFPTGLDDNKRQLNRGWARTNASSENYQLNNYVVGNFSTGSIQHQLVAGFNLYREELRYADGIFGNFAPIDLFDPVYRLTAITTSPEDLRFPRQGLGLYLQNQVTLAENLKVLLGGRFDITNQKNEDLINRTSSSQQDEAFSPRVGIVYQPIKPISLYASYSRSFNPQIGRSADNSQFKPERGTQYEIGVKADVTDRLSATLALFDITRSNLLTTDPNNPLFSIQTGEQRSQGVELELSGEILPGWNIIAGYALIDATITKDNSFPVGNQLNNVPKHSLNLWTTYEIQSGGLQGLGFGLGLFYSGERQGDLANSFQLPSYVRTDASIFYKRNKLRAALNVRNLFDVEYFTSAETRNSVFFGDPFTVQGTISWEF